MARYKKRLSKLFIISPDNRSKWREISLAYEPTPNDMFWITIKGESDAKGFVFGIPRCELENTILYGVPADELQREV